MGTGNLWENYWRFRTKFVHDPSLSWANTACWKLGKSVHYVTRLSFTTNLEKMTFCFPEWDLSKEILSWSNAAAVAVYIQVWCKSSPHFCSVPFCPRRELGFLGVLFGFFFRELACGLTPVITNYLKKKLYKFWHIVMTHINNLKILKWWICVVTASCRVLITGVC